MGYHNAFKRWIAIWAGFVVALCQTHANVAEVVDSRNSEYASRFRATCHLGTNLTTEDTVALCAFLTRLPEDDIAKADELPVLKNNVADSLLRQASMPDTLLEAFVEIFGDTRQGEVWREYVIQKIPEFCMRCSDNARRQKALLFLRERAVDTEYIYAGTAVIGLDRVRAIQPEWMSSSEVARLADNILASDRHSLANKISALHVLSANDAARGRKAAIDYLESDTPINLQASALAVVGNIGLPGDRVLIGTFVVHPDMRLRTAATAALARLDARIAPAKRP